MSIVIDINNLNKCYGSFKALEDISFQVKKGQIFGYVGPNGAGKTTTIKIILGLMKPTSGKVNILGGNTFPDTHESFELRSKIGAILDFNGLINDWSGLDNLIFWAGLYNINKENAFSLAKKLIKLVKLEDWEDINVFKYSNGMQKRLSLAKSLISKSRNINRG
ncbi:MAG: ABC transporter ATP-binding protein [Methanobrevibacter sp.]|jgi:ABC-type multidrug transport system ATPase subunit|nr:ABC transporter ATP-binding protein [Methanobrevibacter sp.]